MNESSVTRNRIANAIDKASGRNQKDRIKDAQVATKRRQDAEKDLAAFRKKNAKVLQSSVSETKKNKLEPRSKNSEPYENTGIDEKAQYYSPYSELRKVNMKMEDLGSEDPQSMDNIRLSAIARNPNHPMHTHASAELQRRKLKKAELGEVSVAKLSDYSRASTRSAGKPRQDVHTMDKRIGGQKTADDKIRKSQGKSSNARVAGTEATNELSIDTMIGYKQKAKYSKHRANNSKVANLLRKEPQDPKDDETLRKRKVGDKLYMKKAYKVLRGEATNEAKLLARIIELTGRKESTKKSGGFEEGGRSGGSYAVSTAYAAGRKAGGLGMPKDKTDKDKVRAGRAARDAEFKARRDAARAPAKESTSLVKRFRAKMAAKK